MAKQLQLTISTPCHESWDAMTPVEKGKFCGSCQKQVVDFSNMSDRQVAEFFKKPSTGSVCGRFMTDQLDRGIEIPKKRIPWVKYFFQFALPTFLLSLKSSSVKAQGTVSVKKINKPEKCRKPLMGDTTIMPEVIVPSVLKSVLKKPEINLTTLLQGRVPSIDITVVNAPIDISMIRDLSTPAEPILGNQLVGTIGMVIPKIVIENEINGKVIDEIGLPVYGATIIIKGTNIRTTTDVNGMFSIHPASDWGKIVLVSSSVGFIPAEITVDRKNYSQSIVINIEPVKLNYALMGAIVVTKRYSQKSAKPIPLIPDIAQRTTPVFFKLFPNPVPSGSNLTIEWKQTEEGYYTLQLLNQSGQSVHQQEIWIDNDARMLNINVPPVAAGSYFLVLANKKSGKKFTEKIVIQ